MAKSKDTALPEPVAWNPRKITPTQLEALGKSLAEFGDLGGIVVNRRTGGVVGGNQRARLFRRGECKATVEKELDQPDERGSVAFGYVYANGTRYSYREVDWPLKREQAANIAANQHGGEFDWDALPLLVQAIGDELVPLIGFDDETLNMLRGLQFSPKQAGNKTPKVEADANGNVTVVFTAEEFAECKPTLDKVAEETSESEPTLAQCFVMACKSVL